MDATHPVQAEHRLLRIAVIAALVVLAAVYLVMPLAPLRLNGDVVEMLTLADSFAHGRGLLFHGGPSHYPPGYPVLVASLERVGWANGISLIVLNLMCIGAASVAGYFIYRQAFTLDRPVALLLTTASLGSWILLRAAPVATGDAAFLAPSTGALALMCWTERREGRAFRAGLSGSLVLTILAVLLRTAGIVLAAPLIFTALRLRPETWLHRARQTARPRRIALMLAFCVTSLLLRTEYGAEAVGEYRSLISSAKERDYRLTGLIKAVFHVALNLPPVHGPLPTPPVMSAAGVVILLFWWARGLWSRRARLGAVDVYLVAHLALMACWPFPSQRLWLPAQPVLFGWMWAALQGPGGAVRFKLSAAAWGTVYACFAAATVAYSVRLSLSGPRFPEIYANGHVASAYHVVDGTAPASASAWYDGIAMLRTFESRLAPAVPRDQSSAVKPRRLPWRHRVRAR